MEHLSDDELTGLLRTADEDIDRARARVIEIAAECRRRRWSFGRIGTALGVSRQAAWERFHATERRD